MATIAQSRSARSRAALAAAALLTGSLVCAGWRAPKAPPPAQPRKPAGRSTWDVEAREYLGTPASEAAVTRALAYLAAHQDADGHWRSGGYPNDVGITGLCVMAFLASGYQPGRGRYGLALNLAVDYLANSVHMGGDAAPVGEIRRPDGGPPMYGHGFATLALAELFGMTKRRDLKPKLEAAVHLIEDTQSVDGTIYHDGGWRYQPARNDADISVSAVQILALRAARNAGIRVSQSTLDRALAFIKRCATNRDGGFNYQVGQHQSGPARTGAGVLALLMAGMRDSPECQGGLTYLVQHPLDYANMWPYREHYYYALYYVTQAMYQAGGDYWRAWYPVVRDRLVIRQDPDGGWSRDDGYSEAGAEYATAMAVLVLQVPAGLLPIYQK